MATLTIENLPDSLHERLVQAAQVRGTTPEQLVIERIEALLPPVHRMTEAQLMAEIADIRAGFVGPPFTPAELQAAIEEGRE